MVEVNWIAVVLAGLSTMVVGAIWYAKPVFGLKWVKLIGKTEKHLAKANYWALGATLVVSLITAYVLAIAIFVTQDFVGGNQVWNALIVGLLLWLGFVATRFITHDAFEGRRKKLTLLNIVHELVTIEAMALIIALLP